MQRSIHLLCLATLALLLTACAGQPALEELHARVIPDRPLEVGEQAELRVSLEHRSPGGGETIAESRYGAHAGGPFDVVLRYDARALESAADYELRAEIREEGRVTHVNAEPVTLTGAQATARTFDIPLEARPGID